MKPIVLHRRLPHPVERVWRAVTDPDELVQWFVGGRPGWTPSAGETFEAAGAAGRVVAFDPPRAFSWEWGEQTFRFDLEPDGDACRLTFTHRFDTEVPDQFKQGWEIYLTRLDALLAGAPLGEQEAHDERQLMLGDSPELRLERHFAVGADRLWRALTDPGELQHWFPGEYELLESDPPRRLVARWNEGTTLRFELAPEGPVTRLTFVHAFDDRDQAALAAAGWDRCFVRLEALLGGAPMSREDSLELWDFVHGRYVERFAS